MVRIIFLLLFIFSTAQAGAPIIFSGSDAKTLKQNIDLFGVVKILSGSTDPSSSAVSAPEGSLYLSTNGNTYQKQDSGLTINWAALAASGAAANISLSNLSTTNINQPLQTADASGTTNNLSLKTGNSSAGNSGDIDLVPGTASGTRGSVYVSNELRLLNGSSHYFGQKYPTSTNSYTVAWPTAQGAANSLLLNDGSGNLSWLVADSANTVSTLVQRDSSGNFSAGTITAALSGNATTSTTATNATNVATTATNTTNATFYPSFVASASSGNQGVDTATGLTFNPSTNTLATTTFSGALTGTASGNTTYTANNHGIVVSGSGNAMSVIAPDSSTSKVLKSGGASADPSWLAYDNANTASTLVARDSSGNFSAGTITASLSGNATTSTSTTNTTNVGITDDTTTNATMYPTWVTSNSGNLPEKVSSTKLTFNPSTANLTTTTFTGALAGNATTSTTATNATNVATTSTSTNASFFPLFVSSSTNSNQAASLGTGLTFNPSTNNLSTTTFTGALSGNSTTATTLQTARTINGTSFDGSGNITVTAAAGTLTGSSLNSTVTGSSLTSLGTIGTGVWNGTKISEVYGGTNQSTYTLGDFLYASAANTLSKLAGNTTSTKNFLVQTGTGTVSAAPSWGTIAAADVPTLNQNTTGTASNVTGTVAIGNGGTGQTTKAAGFDALSPMSAGGDLIYGGASGTGTRLANGSAGQVLKSNGTTLAPTWTTDIGGNAGTATALQTARTINGTSFDGTGNITVTAAAGTLTGTTLNSTVVSSSLTSVGTIATGTWNGTTITETHGGTNQSTYTLGDTLYSSASNTLSKLSGNITSTKKFMSQTGTGTVSAAPSWATIANTDLSGITNTQLSGSAAISNANLATMSAHTFKGNNTGSSATPLDLTATQLTAELNNLVGDSGAGGTKGLVPAPATGDAAAGKVLKADGTWGTVSASSPLTTKGDIYAYSTTNDRLPVGTNGRVLISDSNQTLGLRYQDAFPKNYISVGSDAEVDTSGWATYFDSAGNKPVDGTGGTATNLTFSRSTSSPLSGVGSFSIVQANSTSLQGKGVSYDFTIDAADKAKPLAILFDYNASSTFVASNGTTAPLNDGTTSTNAGNSDIEVFIYDVTNTTLIPVTSQVITGNGANNFQFKGTFQTASNSTSYRLIFHVATTSANATGWTFKYDNVFVGRQATTNGSYVGDWTDESSSFTVNGVGSIGNTKIFTKKDGDRLWVSGIYQNGTTAISTWSIQLPSKYVIDSSKLSTSSQGVKVGFGNLHSASGNMVDGSSNQKTNMIFYDGSTTDRVFPTYLSTTSGYTKINGNDPGGSTNAYFSFDFSVPILGWGSTTQLSNDTDTRVVAARVSGNAGSTTNNTPISFPTADFDTHGGYSAGRYTAPVSGYYKVHGFFTINVAGDVINLYKNASLDSQAGAGDPNGNVAISTIIKLVAGDIIDLRPGTTGTVAGGVIAFERLSGPSAIAATETVSMRYYSSSTSLSGSLATITYATKDWDTHGGYGSGTYTVPASGKYHVNASIKVAATFALNNTVIIELQKNGTVVSRNTVYAAAAVTDLNAAITDEVNCLAGDTIIIQVSSSGTSPSIASSNFENYLSLVRVGN